MADIPTRKLDQLNAASAVGSDDDIVVIRFADGSGVKKLTVAELRKAMAGDIATLGTTDKTSTVAAINELNTAEKGTADLLAPLVFANAGSHNGVFRGKDITANVTDGSFFTNIKNGTFKDIYIGDYFTKTVNGTAFVFRVAGLDVYLHRGSTEFTSHHAVIVPDGIFGKFQMNSSNTTAGGYVATAMYTNVLPTWAGYLATAFGSNLLTNRELLTNAISGENPSNWSWYDSKINLLTSEEAVGHGGFGMSGTNYGFNVGIAYGQLPLFRLAPEFICNREVWWLRNVTSAADSAVVNYNGRLSDDGASNTWGLRPRFLLG